MSNSLVTSRQAEYLRKMANDKGVERDQFQKALDDGSFARLLDLLKDGLGGLVPPYGARLHIVRARVNHGREWRESVRSAGYTPKEYNVWKMSSLYPPMCMEEVEKNYVLLNFSNDDKQSFQKAVDWAQSVGLRLTVPREAFAIGDQHPDLNYALGSNLVYIVATTQCVFEGTRQVCEAWLEGSDRGAGACMVSDINLSPSRHWFAFCK